MTDRCSKCGGLLKEGFFADASHQAMRVGHWAEGPPSYRFLFFLRMRGRKMLPVKSFRCTRCGFLESYATESSPR